MKLTTDEILKINNTLKFAISDAETKLKRTKEIFYDEPGSICIKRGEESLENLQIAFRLILKAI